MYNIVTMILMDFWIGLAALFSVLVDKILEKWGSE
jgi:hypothetical protein